ncbi:NAD(P)/FAD-dependent oxidoreductase [Amycolatopsis sp. K13G38]|uniref:NAD(P)/FAD-dependent oxidoreductase n=1 Tax=Amycolatopsis acididurans TaxID=2724524 RepID=A0ABX1JER0_9PSEU|nr:NAD(P)/FAD-dependent oxidoreductase [Amycolatopsis acididurans]NKQ58287.1 NAD(P)/FAD-dependent oxidoreductase [Amycolatopsis acididurans]
MKDVVVIGGGAAGLSGALILGRSRRSVLVIDSRRPRNAPAEHMHGYLSRDGMPPGDLLEVGREEVRSYGGEVITGEVTGARKDGDGFTVTLAGGGEARARRLLVTTGLTDEIPDIPGLAERWGRDVVHCPYCHGWEVRDQPVGVLSTGPMALHQVKLFRQLTPDLTLFTHTAPRPGDDELKQLAARGVAVVDGQVTALEVTGDELTGIRLADGTVVPRRALAVAPRMVAHAGFLAGLGLKTVEHPSGMGEYVPADETGQTSVPGVYVAGNVTDISAQVIAAAAAGTKAGAMINMALVDEDTGG